MSQLNDVMSQALIAQGFGTEGEQLNSMLLAWLQSLIVGELPQSLPDAWSQMLLERSYDTDRNTGWSDMLEDLGYQGSISDQELQFWSDGGIVPEPS